MLVAGALALAGGSGCASTTAPATAAAPSVTPDGTAGGEADTSLARVEALETEAERRERRIRELESRLALADAEVRDLRDEAHDREDAAAAPRTVVRIGGPARPSTPEPETETETEIVEAEPEDTGPRPVLRLYGPPELPALPYAPAPMTATGATAMPAGMSSYGAPAPMMPAPMMPAPMGVGSTHPGAMVPSTPMSVLGSLPVVAPPGVRSAVPPIPERPLGMLPPPPSGTLAIGAGAAPRRPAEEPAVREYQAALGHVAARRFDEALAGLGAFLSSHPQHPYADNAMYWRGEVLYMRRDFAAAERELADMVRRFPQGNKVPDALLRLGFCRQRQGDLEGARSYFRRVRTEHPGTVAARLASREDT